MDTDPDTAWTVRRVGLSVLFLLVVALPLYPELFGLDEVTPFTQLVAFRPQLLILVLVLGLVMPLRWSWRIAAGLVILLALTGGALLSPRGLSDPTPPPPGTRVLTVMVANVLGGGADAAAVAKLIQTHKPDIVSLPEAQVDVRQEIEKHLRDVSYYGYTKGQRGGRERHQRAGLRRPRRRPLRLGEAGHRQGQLGTTRYVEPRRG